MPRRGSFLRSGRVGTSNPPDVEARPRAPEEPKPSVSREIVTPIPKRFRRGLRGTARDVQVREVSSKGFSSRQSDYLSFRLEVTDAAGNIIEQIPIELRAENIPGRVIRDGDPVIVLGKRTRQGFVKPRAVYVINSKLEIRVVGARAHGFFATVLALPLGLAFLAAWPALAYGIFAGAPEWVLLSVVTMIVYWAIYIRD